MQHFFVRVLASSILFIFLTTQYGLSKRLTRQADMSASGTILHSRGGDLPRIDMLYPRSFGYYSHYPNAYSYSSYYPRSHGYYSNYNGNSAHYGQNYYGSGFFG
ncbi:hypothetical protein Ddc_03206 [Ditylenchus destructor]|nr:hypothetical protein Ddc_03206 [Ditylenchus destructor]